MRTQNLGYLSDGDLAVRRTDGARIPFIIPPALAQELARFSQRSGATLFITLLAAFQVMLMRYTDQEDIVVGTLVAGRIDVATEPLIGCFMNTLALRVSARGAPTFTELLQRVRATTLEADAHQHVPFEQLVEAYQPARDLSYTPLFQVMFMFQNMPLALPELTWLRVALQDIDTGAARFDLSLIVADVAQELRGMFEYRTDLFLPATIRRMIGHFRTLLEAIVRARQYSRDGRSCTHEIARPYAPASSAGTSPPEAGQIPEKWLIARNFFDDRRVYINGTDTMSSPFHP